MIVYPGNCDWTFVHLRKEELPTNRMAPCGGCWMLSFRLNSAISFQKEGCLPDEDDCAATMPVSSRMFSTASNSAFFISSDFIIRFCQSYEAGGKLNERS